MVVMVVMVVMVRMAGGVSKPHLLRPGDASVGVVSGASLRNLRSGLADRSGPGRIVDPWGGIGVLYADFALEPVRVTEEQAPHAPDRFDGISLGPR